MKTNAIALLAAAATAVLLLLAPCCRGFAPLTPSRDVSGVLVVAKTKAATAPPRQTTKKIDEIAHELEELGQEIQPHLSHPKHGFNEYHEGLVHKLRRTIHEKDVALHETLDAMEKRERQLGSVERLQHTLEDIQKQLVESKAYAIAWETTEVNLRNEVRHREKQESHQPAIQELLATLQRIEKDLSDTDALVNAWETAEVELYREKQDHQQEHDSVRRLLWQAVKLSGRRVKNGVVRIFKWKK